MATSDISVSTTRSSDAEHAISTVTLAFMSDPIVRWVIPDPQVYLSTFPAMARAFGGKAFEHGTAHHVNGYRGVALWLPPGVTFDEETLGSLVQQSVPGKKLEAVFGVLEQMGSFHPSEPHWYLPMIGVGPFW